MKKIEFNFSKVIERVMPEMEERVNYTIKSKPPEEKYNRTKFFNDVNGYKEYLPISEHTYRKYLTMYHDKSEKYSGQNMKLSVLFDICQYTEISADYYLGFIDTKRKEPSAPAVKEHFGLSDESMDTLSQIKKRGGEVKGGLSADLMNYIFEDKSFWNELDEKLPAYIAALVYNLDKPNTDAARYLVMRAFENLLDSISEKCINSDLPNAKIDQVAPFQFD